MVSSQLLTWFIVSCTAAEESTAKNLIIFNYGIGKHVKEKTIILVVFLGFFSFCWFAISKLDLIFNIVLCFIVLYLVVISE